MSEGLDTIIMLLQVHPEEPPPDIASEEIRDLALQAIRLPSTLSKSQIEKLGLAVLAHSRR